MDGHSSGHVIVYYYVWVLLLSPCNIHILSKSTSLKLAECVTTCLTHSLNYRDFTLKTTLTSQEGSHQYVIKEFESNGIFSLKSLKSIWHSSNVEMIKRIHDWLHSSAYWLFELEMQRNDVTQLLQSHKLLTDTVVNYYRMFGTL